MGCDIHPHIEYVTEGYKGAKYSRHFAKLNGDRDYLLFGLLTNGQVRIPDATGYAPSPRGLPELLSWSALSDATLFIVPDDSETDEEGYVTTSHALKYANSYGCSLIKAPNGDAIETLSARNLTEIPKGWNRIEHPDWHSHSWLTTEELDKVIDAYPKAYEDIWGIKDGVGAVSAEVVGWRDAMKALDAQDGVVEARLVYWFDN